MDGRHATGSFLSKDPVQRDGKLDLIDYEKLSDMPVSDFELMGYAIGILINRVNALTVIHNTRIDDENEMI